MRDFFDGNTYINHLLAEHRRLHKWCIMLRSTSARGRRKSTWPEISLRFARIGTALCRGGRGRLFGRRRSLAARAISPSAEHIKDEHPFLMQELDRLIARAKVLQEKRIANFSARLRRLLPPPSSARGGRKRAAQQGFGMAVNGDDAKVDLSPSRDGYRFAAGPRAEQG